MKRESKDGEEYFFDAQGRRVPDPHCVLGLSPGASRDEVQARYRKRVRLHPPEKDPEGFELVSLAYRRLTDPEQALIRCYGRVRTRDPLSFGLPTPTAPPEEGRSLEDELLVYALVQTLPFGEP